VGRSTYSTSPYAEEDILLILDLLQQLLHHLPRIIARQWFLSHHLHPSIQTVGTIGCEETGWCRGGWRITPESRCFFTMTSVFIFLPGQRTQAWLIFPVGVGGRS